jgi:hypothetical protein
MIERISRDRVGGVDEESITSFIESDFKIRSGLCPNGCGLLTSESYGQSCAACNFETTQSADKVAAQ